MSKKWVIIIAAVVTCVGIYAGWGDQIVDTITNYIGPTN